MTIFGSMHVKAAKGRQNPVGICGVPCLYTYIKCGYVTAAYKGEKWREKSEEMWILLLHTGLSTYPDRFLSAFYGLDMHATKNCH